MIKYLAYKKGEELKGEYFDTPREAYDHIKQRAFLEETTLEEYGVELVEIPE